MHGSAWQNDSWKRMAGRSKTQADNAWQHDSVAEGHE